MDIFDELNWLSNNVTSHSFRDMARSFEETLKQSRHISRQERDDIWQRYQQIWERRRAFVDERKRAGEEAYAKLKADLDGLKGLLETREFADEAKAFQDRLKQAAELAKVQREELWGVYQDLWEKRKKWTSKRKQASETARLRYATEISSIDFSYDGAFMLQSFSNWEHVGEKVRDAREKLKAIGAAVKGDGELLHEDRKFIFGLLDDIRFKVKSSEETTFSVHGERADNLFNEASRAVDYLSPGEARPILKAASAEIRSLWLTRAQRDKYQSWIDDLWQKLKYKQDEARKQRDDEWRSRQQQGLEKLMDVESRARDALDRVRSNISSNWSRLSEARSQEYQDRVNEWIREGQEKERDIERSIEELESKIRDIHDRLRR